MDCMTGCIQLLGNVICYKFIQFETLHFEWWGAAIQF